MHKQSDTNSVTIQFEAPEYGYGIFCFNQFGDLFLNSDWGGFYYSWRAYGPDFKSFLSSTNATYIVDKFENCIRNATGKYLGKQQRKALEILTDEFIQYLKQPETAPVPACKSCGNPDCPGDCPEL